MAGRSLRRIQKSFPRWCKHVRLFIRRSSATEPQPSQRLEALSDDAFLLVVARSGDRRAGRALAAGTMHRPFLQQSVADREQHRPQKYADESECDDAPEDTQ